MRWLALTGLLLLACTAHEAGARSVPASLLQISKHAISPGQTEVLRVTARDLAGGPLAGAHIRAVVTIGKWSIHPRFPRTDSGGHATTSLRVPAVANGTNARVVVTVSNGYLDIPLFGSFRIQSAPPPSGLVVTVHAYPQLVQSPNPVWIVASIRDRKGKSATHVPVVAAIRFPDRSTRLTGTTDAAGAATLLVDTSGVHATETVHVTLSATWKKSKASGSTQFSVQPPAPRSPAPSPTADPTSRPTSAPTATEVSVMAPAPTEVPAATATPVPTPSPSAVPTDTLVPPPPTVGAGGSAATATPTPAPVNTAAPTNTPVPTSTPRPTATPFPTSVPTPTPTPVPTSAACPGTAVQCHLLNLLNQDRAQFGARPLSLVFDSVTDQHAADEVACQCIFHVDSRYPNESFPYPVAQHQFWAENTGYASNVDIVDQEMMAEGTSGCSSGVLSHACNIIDPRWTYVALGIAQGGSYGYYFVVEDFG